MPVIAARLLIIEDDRDSAEFLKLLVEPRGYLVRTAASQGTGLSDDLASRVGLWT